MENISLLLHTKGFFGSVLKSPTQMGSLSINNSVTNISRLGTFKDVQATEKPSALNREHTALQKMKFNNFFLFKRVILPSWIWIQGPH
jgi:hypothetical protein